MPHARSHARARAHTLTHTQVDRIMAKQRTKKDRRIAALRKLGDYMDFDSGS